MSFPIGLQSVYEMYVFGVYYGFILGALQSFSRVVFADLIPPGMETEFFALYEVTDKGSSWVGPVLVGLCGDVLGDVRWGFVVLAVMVGVSVPMVWMVNVEKGKREAKVFRIS